MCGRFTLKTPVDEWIRELFPGDTTRKWPQSFSLSDWRPRYNIAPTQSILVMRRDDSGALHLEAMRWGLVPSWADSIQSSYSMFNARSETLFEKSSFRNLIHASRCVVLADGYYEWQTESPKLKTPFWIHRPAETPFAMAGLWTSNHRIERDRELRSSTVITVPANEDTRQIHQRMPAMLLTGDAIEGWLTEAPRNGEELQAIIHPAAPGSFLCRHVSKQVGNVRNDGRELLVPQQMDLF